MGRPVEASLIIIVILQAQPAPVAHALDPFTIGTGARGIGGFDPLDLVGLWCLPSCADAPQTLLAAHELW